MTFASYFQWPAAVAIAVALAGFTAWLVSVGVRRRRARLAALGTPEMIERLAPGALRSDSRWRLARLGGVALLAGIALAGPRWGAQDTVVRQSGVDVVLALDASLSMLATDERASRLERMREEVRRLRARSPGDRFAILGFAGRSYVLSPPTLDHAGLELFLDNLDPSIVGTAGTALAPPIRQATTLLGLSRTEADQAIVLMSDGEGFDDRSEVMDAAREARRRGIHLITVGFGTEQGANIPVRVDGRPALHRDQAGQVVVTRYEPEMLRLAAQSAAGEFIPAQTPDRAAAVRTALDRLRAEQRTVRSAEFFALRYQWFLLPALVLLVIDSLLATRALRRRTGAPPGGALRDTEPIAAAAPRGRSPATRAGTGVAAAVLLLVLGGCDPYRLMRDPHVAAYNRGTRLLEADSLDPSRRFLRTALESQREEVLHRAGFNLGLTYLLEGLALEGEAADAPLDSALVHYKAVLLRRPADVDAKWNYELALRNRTGGGGGGGGGAGGGGGGADDPEPQPAPQGITPQPRFGLSVEDAEQILDAVADQERDVQGRNQQRTVPQPPPLGKDW